MYTVYSFLTIEKIVMQTTPEIYFQSKLFFYQRYFGEQNLLIL